MGDSGYLSRRAFVGGVGGLGLLGAMGLPDGEPFAPPPDGFKAQAAALTEKMMATFWDARVRQFRAPVRSAESVDSDADHNNGYTVWPGIVALQALVDGERVSRGAWRERFATVYDGLEGYWDPERHAYTAWLRFPGNDDAYYDDNAWMVLALAEAYEVTRERRYLARATEIGRWFLPVGHDKSGSPGGMRWAVSPKVAGSSDRTACSTSGVAAAVLTLARCGVDREENVALARELLGWVREKLVDADGLVRDGLGAPDWHVNETKWTYNTGVTMRAWVEHHRLTGEKESLAEAKRLAAAALDRTKRMYDGLVRDRERTCWCDASFFVHTLVDALMLLGAATKDAAYARECRRNAAYAYRYLRDPADGLYWRNWRLWRIGEAQLRAWQQMTGQEFHLEADDSERSKERDAEKLPVEQRPLVKTLLANAGMARLFWRVS